MSGYAVLDVRSRCGILGTISATVDIYAESGAPPEAAAELPDGCLELSDGRCLDEVPEISLVKNDFLPLLVVSESWG